MTDTVYWIWLQLLFGIGTRRAELFMNYFEHPREIAGGIRAGSRVRTMLTAQELTAWEAALERAEEIRRRTEKKGCTVVTPDHPQYPALLQGIYSKPAALYCKGDLSCLENALCIAMVGTRTHSEYGAKAAEHLAGSLAGCGAVVVSGLAKGIDTESHKAALAAGGKSIGVLGCGIDVDYPRGSAGLKRAMSENGAVITEYPLGTEPLPGNFPHRNRIISGLAHGVVVVEADLKSGSMITAEHALQQGRDVFAVPGSIFSLRETGTHHLIKEGAKLVDRPEDILEEYEGRGFALRRPARAEKAAAYRDPPAMELPEEPPASEQERRALPDGIPEHCGVLYASVRALPSTVDELCAASGLDAGGVLSALTELEIYGLVKAYPGRRFGLV